MTTREEKIKELKAQLIKEEYELKKELSEEKRLWEASKFKKKYGRMHCINEDYNIYPQESYYNFMNSFENDFVVDDKEYQLERLYELEEKYLDELEDDCNIILNMVKERREELNQ